MEKYIREYQLEELIELYSKYDSQKENLSFIKDAYTFANEIHKDHHRSSGELYINHTVRVAIILTELYSDHITIAATLLHETITEKNCSIEDIKSKFGEEVSKLVEGINKISHLKYNASTESMIQQQRNIIVGLAKDVRVIIMKLADRLDNMRTLRYLPVSEQKAKANETLDILAPIAHRLGLNNIKSELEDLSLKYSKRAVYDDISEKLAQSKDERDKAVINMKEQIIEILDEQKLTYEIKGRSKSIYSIYKKLDKGKTFKDLYDLLALRVLIEKEQDCYMLIGLIHSKFKYIPSRFKDYIAMPKNNMYQSLHTTLFDDEGNVFEIQIRTFEMNDIAERGIASHWSYKENGKNSKALQSMEQKLKAFRDVIENEDNEEIIDEVKSQILNEEIYVYTPKGDVIELPKGATPVDFAFKVHSKIGESLIGAIINNNIVPLSYELESGDVVKINTSKTPTGPKLEWLNFVKTSQAKNKIKGYFAKTERENAIVKGELLIEKELRKKKLEFSALTDDKNFERVVEELKIKDLEDLYHAVGSNRITAGSVINCICGENESKEEQILKKVLNGKSKEITIKNDIIVEGIDEIKVSLAKCCMPVFEDKIIGYITKGQGITVHRDGCPNMALNERTICVNWHQTVGKKYKTSILVEAKKTENSLINIINKASLSDITIESVNTNIKNDMTNYEITLLTNSITNLDKYMDNIYKLSFIDNVERIIK